jgi:hypothetical protein
MTQPNNFTLINSDPEDGESMLLWNVGNTADNHEETTSKQEHEHES